MSKKDKTKKPSPKKEVKRPANKKPRPKKYIEARQPRQTKTHEPVAAKQEAETVTVELPPQTNEKRLTKLVSLAADELKVIAEQSVEKAAYKNVVSDLKYLYEECPPLSERLDRNNLRFWFKTAAGEHGGDRPINTAEDGIQLRVPAGVNIDEEVYEDRLLEQVSKKLDTIRDHYLKPVDSQENTVVEKPRFLRWLSGIFK